MRVDGVTGCKMAGAGVLAMAEGARPLVLAASCPAEGTAAGAEPGAARNSRGFAEPQSRTRVPTALCRALWDALVEHRGWTS